MINWKQLRSKIPSRIKLSKDCYYEILWIDSFTDANILGITNYDDKQIIIKNNLSPKLSVITYLHEVTHALSEEYQLNLTETQVLNVEKSLTYILKFDNIFKGSKRNDKRRISKKVRKTSKKTR